MQSTTPRQSARRLAATPAAMPPPIELPPRTTGVPPMTSSAKSATWVGLGLRLGLGFGFGLGIGLVLGLGLGLGRGLGLGGAGHLRFPEVLRVREARLLRVAEAEHVHRPHGGQLLR